ncbi:MAG TPA: PfkB family carbohydrate kinase [Thermoanaerobaculia bacterium]|nr:PfkB family carbohydrate kinase [Thermoanaerobaculia bacterium]
MSILVVGSVAFDGIETPFGKVERAIGGSATYFSVAASFFTPVQLVAVVGEDFSDKEMEVFRGRDIDVSGLSHSSGKTFYWKGSYDYDMNVATTRETQLNVFADFKPVLSENFRSADVVFLANIDPELQLEVLEQVKAPKLVALDTMNYWITSKKEALTRIFSKVDLIIINEGEVRQFSGEANLLKGARAILALGAKRLVIKRGEYGVLMVQKDQVFAVPAYPLESVFDPTGAGDTFAGGFLGYLASRSELTEREMRRAIIFGSVLASFTVEAFALDRLREVSREEIEKRFRDFKAVTHFDDLEATAS